ncbi:predicted protein [Arabidopsis lyrata subsp. lyrata]|uniref:Predicted protein n=1 Tax=Arabidopsis lyrata subsp. lyrata TaxID=81972 RepID=D7MCQ8_ARALL|nr:predicted protein [Arabidopsis lyrata subsp. lyrata]
MHNITDKMQNATSTSTCQKRPNHSISFLAMAVGIKQKELVNKVIQKGSRCDDNSTNPPCKWCVEMMAPVFSREAWRCSWYMIQNDLIHAWGLDTQLGYCAQGDRKKNVGVVDVEYIIHYGLPTLGVVETASSSSRNETDPKSTESLESRKVDYRPEVRMKSSVDMKTFVERWNKAVRDDRCWVDPY